MYLHLSCYDGIGIDLPTTPLIAKDRLTTLREAIRKGTPILISSASCPIPSLYPYIQDANPEDEADLRKLNVLAERIDSMPQKKQCLFSGALELEGTGNLDDALRIVENLAQYEIFPKIQTDEDLGHFLVDTSAATGKFSFPESTQPYLDYAKIGAEQRNTLGGVYTPHGLVKRREEAPVQAETPRTMLLTLKTSEQSYFLALPASEKQLNQAKRTLGIDELSQAVITGVEYTVPSLDQLIPTDCITVENANEMAHCLQQIKADGEMMKYCAALEVEEPGTFSDALDLAIDIDDYEQISDSEREVRHEVA